MKYLLDTSVLLAAFWQTHSEHARVHAWLAGKETATCSIVEIGFLRISVHPKGPFQASMPDALLGLNSLSVRLNCTLLADDLSGKATPKSASHLSVGDIHLAELAHQAGMKFATLDTKIKHPAVVTI